MKRIYLTLLFLSLFLMSSFVAAQQNQKGGRHFDKEAFEEKRSEFLTKEIGLTKEEAAAFIPLYNELKNKMFAVGHECRKSARDLRNKKNPTDADYLKVVNCNVEIKQKEVELELEYLNKFKKILSPEKLYKYQRAEYKFAREFMKGNAGKK